eukprot:TRINITY_DN8140_c0_g1_i1.p1 TRINITY_DN8140_c0_g1~~TRINITY_DN8140_c0_g1_i1.p1  ORF type:complete len:708 (+),score=63.44 TRINITY_DN8140_c0_g1_i1:803-2926(+)
MPDDGNPEVEERILEKRRREARYRMAAVVICTFLCVLVILGGIASNQEDIPVLSPDYESRSTAYQITEHIQKFGSRSAGTAGHNQMQGFLRGTVSTLRAFANLRAQLLSEQSLNSTTFFTSIEPQFVNSSDCHVMLVTSYATEVKPEADSGASIGVFLSLMYNLEKFITSYPNRKSACQVSFVFLDGLAQDAARQLTTLLASSDKIPSHPSLVAYMDRVGFEGRGFPRFENSNTYEEYDLLRNIQQHGFSHVNLFSGKEVSSVDVNEYPEFGNLQPAKWLPLIGVESGSGGTITISDNVLSSADGILSQWMINKMSIPLTISYTSIRRGTCVENGFISIVDSLTCSLIAEKQFLPFSEQDSNAIAFGCSRTSNGLVMNTRKTTYSMATSASDLFPHICAELPGVVEADLPSRIWNITEEMLSYGTRVGGSGSSGYNQTKDLIYSSFMKDTVKDSWKIFNQSWSEEKGNFTNFYAQSTFGDLASGHVVLSAHYDSKFYEAPIVFVGAIDSAVSCAALIAWVEHMSVIESLEEKWSLNSPVITIIFFDGEEAFDKWQGTDHTYGSRHLAYTWDRDKSLPGLRPGSSLSSVTLFVLFDLIGCANQPINGLQPITRSQFATLGRLDAFISASPTLYTGETNVHYDSISDDHKPFVAARPDLPLMHLIPDRLVYPWHTPDDDLEHLDKDVIKKFALATWRFILMIVTQPNFV